MMGAQGVQKIMGYSKSNLVTEVTAAEAKARQIAAAAVTYPKTPVAAEVGRFLSFGRGLPAPYVPNDPLQSRKAPPLAGCEGRG